MVGFTITCCECGSMILVDKKNFKIYCRKCNKSDIVTIKQAILLVLPFIEMNNIECDEADFEKYKL